MAKRLWTRRRPEKGVKPYPGHRHLTASEVAKLYDITRENVYVLYRSWLHTGKITAHSLPGYTTPNGTVMFDPNFVKKVALLRQREGREDQGKLTLQIPFTGEGYWNDLRDCPHCGGSLSSQLAGLKDGQHQIVCPACGMPLLVERETLRYARNTLALDEERLREWRIRRGIVRPRTSEQEADPGPAESPDTPESDA